MPAQQTSSTCTRSVTFAATAKARCILHINDYTEKQKRLAFYTAQEMHDINLENKATLRKMSKNEGIDETQLCTRGLERHLREASKLRKIQQRAAVSAVLAQQYYLIEEKGETDQDIAVEESIALVYSSMTGPSVVSAHLMGLADAKFVQEQTNDMQQDKSRMHQLSKTASSCRRLIQVRIMKEQNTTSAHRQIFNSAA